MRHSFCRFALLGALIMGLGACSSSPADEAQIEPQPFPFVRLSPTAPPQPPLEQKYPPEEPMKEVWRAGFWKYDGMQFEWVPGHYMMRPDPTASWTSDRWEQRTFGWAFVPGFWQ